MAAKVQMKLDQRFTSRARGLIEKYDFDVGILKDRPHKKAKSKAELKSFAGGPARRTSGKVDGTLNEVSKKLRQNLGVNFYIKPFRSRANVDLLNFMKRFFDLVKGRSQKRRLENALQAVVRNPILRGDYGNNSELTAKIKGFDRLMIDTGQFFKGITAKARLKRVSK